MEGNQKWCFYTSYNIFYTSYSQTQGLRKLQVVLFALSAILKHAEATGGYVQPQWTSESPLEETGGFRLGQVWINPGPGDLCWARSVDIKSIGKQALSV